MIVHLGEIIFHIQYKRRSDKNIKIVNYVTTNRWTACMKDRIAHCVLPMQLHTPGMRTTQSLISKVGQLENFYLYLQIIFKNYLHYKFIC